MTRESADHRLQPTARTPRLSPTLTVKGREMKHMKTLLVAAVLAAGCSSAELDTKRPAATDPSHEATADNAVEAGQRDWKAFVSSLDMKGFARDYPGPVRDLDTRDANRQRVALNVLAASESPEALPFIVPLLDSPNRSVRIYAGSALKDIVSAVELKRRDRRDLSRVVLRPRTSNDPDLRPMRWVVIKMMSLDNGSTQSYAVTMAGYIGFADMEAELRTLVLQSRHPAVVNAAKYALRLLGLSDQQKPEPLAVQQ